MDKRLLFKGRKIKKAKLKECWGGCRYKEDFVLL